MEGGKGFPWPDPGPAPGGASPPPRRCMGVTEGTRTVLAMCEWQDGQKRADVSRVPSTNWWLPELIRGTSPRGQQIPEVSQLLCLASCCFSCKRIPILPVRLVLPAPPGLGEQHPTRLCTSLAPPAPAVPGEGSWMPSRSPGCPQSLCHRQAPPARLPVPKPSALRALRALPLALPPAPR